MQSTASSPQDYINLLPEDRKEVLQKLRKTILEHLSSGYSEIMNYGMICYVVPHSLYPNGYHCNPKDPLPFLSIASQKNFIAIYHMGLYANPQLLEWFKNEYPKHSKNKLDMGKSCIRFKKIDQIPFNLIATLVEKITPEDYISIYNNTIRKPL